MDQEANPSLKTLIQKLQYLQEIKSNVYYYLLVIHSVHLDGKAKEAGIKAFSPNRIVNDILNLIALYYSNYFMLEEENYPRIDQKLLKKMIINNTQNPSKSQELSHNINNICQLRIEQFYLLQRGLSLFNHALHSIKTNISIAFCFLISSIETYAEKYGDISDKWEDYKHINFYNILKNSLEKIENKELSNELFQEIGERYIIDSHSVLAKLRKFILDFVNPSFRLLEDINDNYLKMLISDYYSLRSSYMHSGKELPISDINKLIIYNVTDKGKIKTYDKGSKYEVKVLLPLSYLITIIRGCIINFIRHLFNNRELESDKRKYKETDKQPRGTHRITAKTKLSPGMAFLGKDIQRKEQYLDLYNRSQEIAKLDQQKNYIEKTIRLELIKEKIETSDDIERRAMVFSELGVAYMKNEEIDRAIEYNQKSFEVNLSENNLYRIAEDQYNFGFYYCLQNKNEKAIEYFKKAFEKRPEFIELALAEPELGSLKEELREFRLQYKDE